jgi:DNA processing protein
MIRRMKSVNIELSATTKYWAALSSIRGVGPKTVQALVSQFGSPEKALSASIIDIARTPRLNPRLAWEIVGVRRKLASLERFIAQVSKAGIEVLCPDSCEYPHLLKLIEDFPPILYRKGAGLPEDEATVAIVGTRVPTSEGIEFAERMAMELVKRGFVVVSGLARGIDTAVHRGTLEASGKTLAVIGSGLKMVYPPENRQLAGSICSSGSILSECHPNELASGQRLIQRNRIISGLSLGVILIEPKSGALNAAERALEQGRCVFIYDPEKEEELSRLLSDKVFSIRGLDQVDAVAARLKALEVSRSAENEGDQMYLL